MVDKRLVSDVDTDDIRAALGIVAVVDAAVDLGVEAFILGGRQQVAALEIEAAIGEAGFLDEALRKRVADLKVLQAEVAARFEERLLT